MPQKTEKNQAVPIPDDWSEDSWFCIKVQWPNSPRWISVLTGLLSQPMRGRFWNGQTGTVTEAQEVGQEIWDRNILFNPCDGSIIDGDTGDSLTGGGLVLVPSEWMENMITDVDFDCTTGILTFKSGLCCVKQIDLSCLQTTIGTDDDPYDPPQEYQACNKASGLVDMLWALLDAGWDAQGSFPTQWVGLCEASVPGYDLSNSACWSLVQQSVDLDNDYSKSEVLTDFRKQQVKCLLSKLLDDTTVGISQAQYDAYRGLASVVFEGEQRQWALTGIEAFGAGNCSNIAALAAPVTADCTCPEDTGETEPTVNGWYLGAPVPDGTFNVPYDPNGAFPLNDWGWAWHKEVADRDVFGFVATLSLTSGSMGIIKRANDPIDFMGSHDVYLSDSNSDSFGNPLKIAQMNADEFDELGLAAQNYTRVQPLSGDGYSSPSTPPVSLGDIVLMAFSLQQSGSLTGVVTMSDFRWMHNTASPNP